MATMINAAGTGSEADQRKIESAIRRLQQILDSIVVAEIPVDQDKIAFSIRPRRQNRKVSPATRPADFRESAPANILPGFILTGIQIPVPKRKLVGILSFQCSG